MKQVFSFLILSSLSFSVFSQQIGNLDSSFATNGGESIGFGAECTGAYGTVVQSDGKIIVVGDAWSGSEYDAGIMRLKSDGSLDSTFGVGGRVATNFGSTYDINYGVAIQNDGKIVTAGSTVVFIPKQFAIARYKQNGNLDSSFGNNGMQTSDVGGGSDEARAIAIQNDGKILLAGYATTGGNKDFGIVRYNSDGSLDNTFGTAGKIKTNINPGDDDAWAIAVQPDGKIVVAGSTNVGTSTDFAIARYDANGTLDNTFNTTGIVTTNFDTGSDEVHAIAIQPDNKILAGGFARAGTKFVYAIARYNADGSLDNSFGTGGKVMKSIRNEDDKAYAMLLQPDGNIILGGSSLSSSTTDQDFALCRFRSDGTVDNSFGTNGITTTAFETLDDYIRALAFQPDGKIVAAGNLDDGSHDYYQMGRYISGLVVGVLGAKESKNAVLIYPNPIKQEAEITYTLARNDQITISIVDLQGKVVSAVLESTSQTAGEHKQKIDLPQTLADGNYQVIITGNDWKTAVRIVKGSGY